MKKRILGAILACAMTIGLLAGCGGGGSSSGGSGGSSSSGGVSTSGGGESSGGLTASAISSSWKVTCPWAPSGVAAMVSQMAATKSPDHSDSITLVAEAIAGDAATVNTWVLDTEANDPELVFVGEGLLSITSIIDPSKMQFGEEDLAFVENLYSSIFVLSADADLNINTLDELEAYVAEGNPVSVAARNASDPVAPLTATLTGLPSAT